MGDRFDRLYAPWRRSYHTSPPTDCVFCGIVRTPEKDRENWVLYRDEVAIVVMNLYPYNPGHFMIIPTRHEGEYEKLPPDELCHISHLSQKGVALLKRWGAKGVNLGWNVGEVGGAGIPGHLHLHLVPRFPRDTNMMTTIFHTRVYSADFDQIYRELLQLAPHFFGKR